MLKIIIFIIISFFIFKLIYEIFLKKHQNLFAIYFGLPGSGKTTFGAWYSKKYLKKKINVFSNVSIKGTYKLEPLEDIGHYNIEDGLMIIDEAGLEYDNRSFKSFPKPALHFFKFHRHYNVDVVMFSQDLDMDKKLRKLANKLYLVQPSFFPYFISRREIIRKVGVDSLTHDIVDMYDFKLFGRKLIFSPTLWKLFNTRDRVTYPDKNWEKWGESVDPLGSHEATLGDVKKA